MHLVESEEQLNTIELFAGVGGFRLGLEGVHGKPFQVTVSNQFDPSRNVQHASNIYRTRWGGDGHLKQDIAAVLNSKAGQEVIRLARPDVIVGGFPCQDYSVVKPPLQAQGVVGKKGVLWWSIAELLRQRLSDGEPVKYLILESVERLISSPAMCCGRDFAMVLSTLYQLGYAADWRVVNAADYGFPPRRRRTFVVGYHESTGVHRRAKEELSDGSSVWFDRSIVSAKTSTPFFEGR